MGLARLSWKALDPKNIENSCVLKVFANARFRYFEALDGPLGPIVAPLGPIWSKMGPQNGPQSGPKNAQKLVQKMNLNITRNLPILGPNMGPKMSQDGEVRARAHQDRVF